MAKPRLSSPGRNLPSFQTDSERNPNDFQTPRVPPGTRVRVRDGERKRQTAAALAAAERSSASFAAAFAWADEQLPDEASPFAAGAFLALRYTLKRDPSADEVRARLLATGRDRSSVDALAAKYNRRAAA